MNSKLKSILINVVLFAVIVFLALKVIQSIKAPIDFSNEKNIREAQIVQRLKDIRDAEIQYKQANNKYCSTRRCTGVSLPLHLVPSPTGLPSKRCPASGSFQERTGKSGSFGMWHHPRGSSRISS